MTGSPPRSTQAASLRPVLRWAAAVVVVLVVAACSAPGASHRAPASQPSAAGAAFALAQCFVKHRLIPARDLPAPAVTPQQALQWLHGGQAQLNRRFGAWLATLGNRTVVAGKTIAVWVSRVIRHPDGWPARICGRRPAGLGPRH